MGARRRTRQRRTWSDLKNLPSIVKRTFGNETTLRFRSFVL